MAFFPSLKQIFFAYHSYKVSDSIFEIHQLWQSGFSRVYSNSCCSCSFEPEIIKISQSSHKMYSNNIVNFQESTTILNACKKKCLETYWMHQWWWTCNIGRNLDINFSMQLYFSWQSTKLLWSHRLLLFSPKSSPVNLAFGSFFSTQLFKHLGTSIKRSIHIKLTLVCLNTQVLVGTSFLTPRS